MEPKPQEQKVEKEKAKNGEVDGERVDSGNPEDPNSASYDEKNAKEKDGPDLASKYKKDYEYYVPEIVNK
jgi:hypothetical protein